jgi:leucyl aminopeptidase
MEARVRDLLAANPCDKITDVRCI